MQSHETTLGEQLRTLRFMSQQSLRTVADATGYSAAYLLKLERDDVRGPSPHLLRALARHFSVSYLGLMELAGYATDEDDSYVRRVSRHLPVADLVLGADLTATDQRALVAFITTLKSRYQT